MKEDNILQDLNLWHRRNPPRLHGIHHQGLRYGDAAETPLEAKLLAFLRNAQLCLHLGIQDVIFEGDSFITWNNINTDACMPWRLMPLWKKLQHALDSRWQTILVRHNTNRLADALAKTRISPRNVIYLQQRCLQEEQEAHRMATNLLEHTTRVLNNPNVGAS
ncbi:hypothetical protein AAC387_Pa12g1678 [Persea americana]